MFGLIDCNNFFVSCERVFRPDLLTRPVIVLSNNDGFAIARSNEAKALGIKMAQPAFQIKELIEQHQVAVFSSNYTLYGDMSARVMSIISEIAPEIEVYSIDEAFINFDGIQNIHDLGSEIVRKVIKGTGIPVSLGVAPTKTLAKLANMFAKKYPAYQRLCLIDNEEKRIKALKLTSINDVWGIGRRLAKKLNAHGVVTAYDFTMLSQSWVRKEMTVVGERTWKELRGISCIDMETVPPARKQICTSRSFGKLISDYNNLSEAISTHAASCAEKLRKQKAFASSLMVFIHTNEFREDLPQYWKNTYVKLPVPTSDTLEIIHYALKALKQIYMEGYQYKKVGVIITEISSDSQLGLFDTIDHDKRSKLMQSFDKINDKYPHSVKLAIQGNGRDWKLRQEQLSPRYTTDLDGIITINCEE